MPKVNFRGSRKRKNKKTVKNNKRVRNKTNKKNNKKYKSLKKNGGAQSSGKSKYELVSAYDTPTKMKEIDHKMEIIRRLSHNFVVFTKTVEQTEQKPIEVTNKKHITFMKKKGIDVSDMFLDEVEKNGKMVTVVKYKITEEDGGETKNTVSKPDTVKYQLMPYFHNLERYDKDKEIRRKKGLIIKEEENSYKWRKPIESPNFNIFPYLVLHKYTRESSIIFYNIDTNVSISYQKNDIGLRDFINTWFEQFESFIFKIKQFEPLLFNVEGQKMNQDIESIFKNFTNVLGKFEGTENQEMVAFNKKVINYISKIKEIVKTIAKGHATEKDKMDAKDSLISEVKYFFQELDNLLDLKNTIIANIINREYINSSEDRHEIVLNYCSGSNIYMLLPPFVLNNILNNLKNENGDEPASKYTIFSLCRGNYKNRFEEQNKGSQTSEKSSGKSIRGEDIDLIQTPSFIENIITKQYKKENGDVDLDTNIIKKRCRLFKERLKIVYIQVPIIQEGFSHLFMKIFNTLITNNKILVNQIIHFHQGFHQSGTIVKINRKSNQIEDTKISINLMKEYNGGRYPKLYYYGVRNLIISTKNYGVKLFNSKKRVQARNLKDFYFYDDLFDRNSILPEILGKNPYEVFYDVENNNIDSYAEKYEIIEL